MMRTLAAALFLAACFCAPQAGAFEPGITPVVSAAAEAAHLIKAASGTLYSVYVTTGGDAGYLMTFDAQIVPADGPVAPIECVVAPANNTVSITFHGPPDIYSNGIIAVFSTTGCFIKTASATVFFKARAQ